MLNLFDNGISDAGAIAVAQALRGNVALKSLSLSGNRVGAPGAIELARSLAKYELRDDAEVQTVAVDDRDRDRFSLPSSVSLQQSIGCDDSFLEPHDPSRRCRAERGRRGRARGQRESARRIPPRTAREARRAAAAASRRELELKERLEGEPNPAREYLERGAARARDDGTHGTHGDPTGASYHPRLVVSRAARARQVAKHEEARARIDEVNKGIVAAKGKKAKPGEKRVLNLVEVNTML